MTNHKLAWIQVLRGLAAVMVLMFHARPHLNISSLTAPFSHYFDYGFSGVDIFFVLSGFVVYKSSLRKITAKAFVWNRLSRIYAGYWPVFLIFVCIPLV